MADPAAKEHMAKKVRLEYLQQKCLGILLHIISKNKFLLKMLACFHQAMVAILKKNVLASLP